MDTTEHHLCENIRRGDKNAFEAVFRDHYPLLCSYANKFLNDLDLAEEVVQELFFQLWKNRESLFIQHTLKSYLFRAVHNSCMNHVKHQTVRQMYAKEMKHTKEYTALAQEKGLEFEELQDQLKKSIDGLPPERRKVFLLIKMEGKKYKEAAEILGISVKTVENQMGKAMDTLRQALREYLPLLLLYSSTTAFFCLLWIGEMAIRIVLI